MTPVAHKSETCRSDAGCEKRRETYRWTYGVLSDQTEFTGHLLMGIIGSPSLLIQAKLIQGSTAVAQGCMGPCATVYVFVYRFVYCLCQDV